MNNRKNLYTILVLLTIIVCGYLMIPYTRADSGWDGSYGGGGGYSSGGYSSGGYSSGSYSSGSYSSGSSHSHSYGSSSSSSHHSSYSGGSSTSTEISPDDFLMEIISVIVTFGIMGYTFAILFRGLGQNTYANVVKELEFKVTVPALRVERIKQILPDFVRYEFLDQTYDIYINIQEAWMNFDFDILRKYTTDELFNVYRSQLIVLKQKKQKNIMKDFSILSSEITGMQYNNDSISLDVQMIIECFDYVVDQNDKTLRGNDKNKVCYHYEMTFIKSLTSSSNKCPNCGATLENQNSNICSYCRSTIVSNNHDWILSKKRVLRQRIIDKAFM